MTNHSMGLIGLLLRFSAVLIPELLAPFYFFQNILLKIVSLI